MLGWMLMPLRRYADFTWRARRKEYWLYVLLYAALFATATGIDHLLGYGLPRTSIRPWGASATWPTSGPARSVVALVLFLPSLAVSVRRLHDTDRSGWWLLLSLLPFVGGVVLLLLLCLDGIHGPNRYGGDPRTEEPASTGASL